MTKQQQPKGKLWLETGVGEIKLQVYRKSGVLERACFSLAYLYKTKNVVLGALQKLTSLYHLKLPLLISKCSDNGL